MDLTFYIAYEHVAHPKVSQAPQRFQHYQIDSLEVIDKSINCYYKLFDSEQIFVYRH